MKESRWVSHTIRCPWYRLSGSGKIYCAGAYRGHIIQSCFKDRQQCREYEERYCRKNPEGCIIASPRLRELIEDEEDEIC